jgi:kynurenine formamidase
MSSEIIALWKGEKNEYQFNLNEPLDISIPLHPDGPRAWYADKMRIEPVMNDFFTGSVALGGSVNFRNVFFNPHAHGTHTETMGHIRKDIYSVNQELKTFFFLAKLISIKPDTWTEESKEHNLQGDKIIRNEQLAQELGEAEVEAVVIRTIPNTKEKKFKNYSNTNPCYFEPDALHFLRKRGVKHLLTDLPSVDREEDGGLLLAHHEFWSDEHPGSREATITEMVFVDDAIDDGIYLLNIQIAPLENDASPSKPILYKPIQK